MDRNCRDCLEFRTKKTPDTPNNRTNWCRAGHWHDKTGKEKATHTPLKRIMWPTTGVNRCPQMYVDWARECRDYDDTRDEEVKENG